jgi:hypothetical protein
MDSPVDAGNYYATRSRQIAAALRAAADQVVPKSEPPQRSDFSDLSVYQWAVDVHAYDDATRRKILAIAAELEAQ